MKFIKKLLKLNLLFILILSLLLPLATSVEATTTTTLNLWIGNATMIVNGRKQALDTTGAVPIILTGRTFVPIRAIVEAFGGTVAWEAKTQKITIFLEKKVLELWIGQSQAQLNDSPLELETETTGTVVPLILKGRTLLPLRFVGEALGAEVTYTATTKKITLVYEKGKTVLPPDNSDLLLGNPSGATNNSTATPDNYLMSSGYYALAYNKTRATPNWVSWHLDSTSLGSVDRANDFRADSTLPTGWYQVTASSYSGSGFDRGHNCPSADRTSTFAANSATFLMTNMIPQAPKNNEQLWANFENYLRSLVKEGNEIYIVMGSYGKGGTGAKGYQTTINGGKIAVPAQIWKIALVLPEGNNDLARITTTTRVIAINTPNTNTVATTWQTYLTSIAKIEAATGYNLLANLSATLQKTLTTKIDGEATGAKKKIVPFTPEQTSKELLALLSDETVDVIELAETYHLPYTIIDIARTNPVSVKSAIGATVIMQGDLASPDPQFYFGFKTKAANITMEGLTFENFTFRLGGKQEKGKHGEPPMFKQNN